MTDHLPECCVPWPDGSRLDQCICDRLRACEQRVREEFADHARDMDYSAEDRYRRGRTDGVRAARDAVAALPANQRRSNEDGMGGYVQHADGMGTAVSHPETFTEYLTRSAALAAIDALKGDTDV